MYDTPVGSPLPEEGTGTLLPVATTRPLPKLKVEASISNIRIAIVENAGDDPQALTLRVSVCVCVCVGVLVISMYA